LEKRAASVNIAHMKSRLFPTALAAVGLACVAVALAAARYGTALSHYAL
jgi:methylthioribose-1-phosphate isomerase